MHQLFTCGTTRFKIQCAIWEDGDVLWGRLSNKVCSSISVSSLVEKYAFRRWHVLWRKHNEVSYHLQNLPFTTIKWHWFKIQTQFGKKWLSYSKSTQRITTTDRSWTKNDLFGSIICSRIHKSSSRSVSTIIKHNSNCIYFHYRLHGSSTFVPLEVDVFKESIYHEVLNRKQSQLGRVFRHPMSTHASFCGYVNPLQIKKALELLSQKHPSYFYLTENESDSSDYSDSVRRPIEQGQSQTLRNVTTLQESESLFKSWQVRLCNVYLCDTNICVCIAGDFSYRFR